jgi:LmbE family N-acetylglucosaminyl deacetylase
MATLVTFHAHPDDEAISCGGVMARAAAEGHRVVLVTATRGEQGEVAEGVLQPGETLAELRTAELWEAAGILGVARLEVLGYLDSGMMGTPNNDAPGSFWTADIEEAAGRLKTILEEEAAEVLTIYDANGGYGHPDHIQVHRVGARAAELAATPRVYEAVANAERVREGVARLREAGFEVPVDDNEIGVPAAAITTAIDVRAYLGPKRASMAAHASQIPQASFWLSMPEPLFVEAFGTEWFIRRGVAPSGRLETNLFE